MTSDIGSFSKLYAEAIEAIDKKASEGVLSTGGGSKLSRHPLRNRPAGHARSAEPDSLLLESNTRSATIIGIVGAGGIGLFLAEMIRTYEWDNVAFII